jgi:hypothetical protein
MSQSEALLIWLMLGNLWWPRDRFNAVMCWALAAAYVIRYLGEMWK